MPMWAPGNARSGSLSVDSMHVEAFDGGLGDRSEAGTGHVFNTSGRF
jgi:hypothetical protein